MTPRQRLGSLVVLGAFVSLGFGAAGAGAQGTAMTPHPAHIHEGTCDQLNPAPQYPLTDVSMTGMMGGMAGMSGMGTPGAGMMGSPEAGMTGSPGAGMGGMMGAATAVAVETSETVVPASLQDLLTSPHAINVHESAANIQRYIACGDLGGQVMSGPGMEQGGTLVIGLRELNDSGYAGIAVLEGMGDQTRVDVYLAQGLVGGAAGEYGTPTS
ncbi:MAG: hypothetical protein IT429_24720 [Gemmataceae bacterium]|nr:hypothetical protein [Gemmataceae bacterium]